MNDKNLLIINGERHNYIFEITPSLQEILSLSDELQFSPEFSSVYLEYERPYDPKLTLRIDLPEHSLDSERLQKLGFVRYGTTLSYSVPETLRGGISDQEVDFPISFFDSEAAIPFKARETVLIKAGKLVLVIALLPVFFVGGLLIVIAIEITQ